MVTSVHKKGWRKKDSNPLSEQMSMGPHEGRVLMGLGIGPLVRDEDFGE